MDEFFQLKSNPQVNGEMGKGKYNILLLMDVGEHFTFPAHLKRQVRASCAHYHKLYGQHYVVRHAYNLVWECWRVG